MEGDLPQVSVYGRRRFGFTAIAVSVFALTFGQSGGSYLIVLIQLDQTYTLGRPADSPNICGANTNQLAVGGHHENVRVLIDRHNGHDLAVFVCRPDIDNAFATTALSAVLLDAAPFAESAFRDRQNHLLFGGTCDHRDNIVSFVESNADN